MTRRHYFPNGSGQACAHCGLALAFCPDPIFCRETEEATGYRAGELEAQEEKSAPAPPADPIVRCDELLARTRRLEASLLEALAGVRSLRRALKLETSEVSS